MFSVVCEFAVKLPALSFDKLLGSRETFRCIREIFRFSCPTYFRPLSFPPHVAFQFIAANTFYPTFIINAQLSVRVVISLIRLPQVNKTVVSGVTIPMI